MKGKLYFLKKTQPGVPVECKYAAEVDGVRNFFEKKEEAVLFLFDHGVRTFQFLTKEASEYNIKTRLLNYEFWHIGNRVGYVAFDYEHYVSETNETKKRRSFVWRFVGYGRSLFAQTTEELREMVLQQIQEYSADLKDCGYNNYPFYTRYNRAQAVEALHLITLE